MQDSLRKHRAEGDYEVDKKKGIVLNEQPPSDTVVGIVEFFSDKKTKEKWIIMYNQSTQWRGDNKGEFHSEPSGTENKRILSGNKDEI